MSAEAGTQAGAAPGTQRRDPLGYGIVLLSYLGMAGSAPLVAWADTPAAIILALRMAFAALALGVVFLRRPMLADWRRPGAAWRLIVMAAMSSLTLLLFFFAVLHTSVAIAMFLLPLATWQFTNTGYHLDDRAWIAAVVMGVACTAIPYTLWIEGTRRVRAEHVTILGYIEPVAGPLYAIFLVGQMPTVWTAVGGAPILGAGFLVVLFGRGEGAASPAAVAEPGPI